MKNLILALLVLVTTTATAQKSLFDNISTTDSYDEYWSVWDEDGDGLYVVREQRFIVKFEIKKLATGEAYSYAAVVSEGDKIGHIVDGGNAVSGYDHCKGYPYESVMRHQYEKHGLVSIGDYVFILSKVSEDGTSFNGIESVYVKRAASSGTAEGGTAKKKKFSFKDIANAVKDNYTGSESTPNYGEAHKKLESTNLDKMITDYLVAMKAKQNARTSAEKQKDKNIENAKGQEDADILAYNDSIKATPEYKKMKAHQKAMEEMENGSSSSSSTSSSKTVEVYVDPSGKGTVKIYWKQDGSNKTFTLTGSRRDIGDIPEGTQLSYSVGPDHNKKQTFYTVPSGKSSVSVDL